MPRPSASPALRVLRTLRTGSRMTLRRHKDFLALAALCRKSPATADYSPSGHSALPWLAADDEALKRLMSHYTANTFNTNAFYLAFARLQTEWRDNLYANNFFPGHHLTALSTAIDYIDENKSESFDIDLIADEEIDAFFKIYDYLAAQTSVDKQSLIRFRQQVATNKLHETILSFYPVQSTKDYLLRLSAIILNLFAIMAISVAYTVMLFKILKITLQTPDTKLDDIDPLIVREQAIGKALKFLCALFIIFCFNWRYGDPVNLRKLTRGFLGAFYHRAQSYRAVSGLKTFWCLATFSLLMCAVLAYRVNLNFYKLHRQFEETFTEQLSSETMSKANSAFFTLGIICMIGLGLNALLTLLALSKSLSAPNKAMQALYTAMKSTFVKPHKVFAGIISLSVTLSILVGIAITGYNICKQMISPILCLQQYCKKHQNAYTIQQHSSRFVPGKIDGINKVVSLSLR